RQPPQLRLYQNPRHPRLPRPLRQRRPGQPRPQRKHGNRTFLHGNKNRSRHDHIHRSNAMMTAERQIKLADLDTLRLQDMDTSGIDLQVISDMGATIAPRPGDEGVQLAREANDQLAQACATHPDRFAGFATLPMTQPEAAADELERAVRSLGLKGAMLFGTTNGRFLDDPAFLPVLERAVALSVPIYLHPAFPP